ncbi:MAG: hypothetical protein R3B70_23240 [Polyangiaceae bacterium]
MAMGRIVAIRVLHPENAQKREAVTRLQHEARVTGNLGHPNICEIYDMGRLEDGGYVRGDGAAAGRRWQNGIRRTWGRSSRRRRWRSRCRCCRRWGAAHASGIIHRDLKPENVFLAEKPGAGGDEAARLRDLEGDDGRRRPGRAGN